jgi:hypothetical protein
MDVTTSKPNGKSASNGHAHAPASEAPRATLSLDELLAMDGGALLALYRNGSTPRLQDLDGEFRGRMLAIPGIPVLVSQIAERFYRMIWRGKSFRSTGATGEGMNHLLGGRVKALHYTTVVAASRAGAFDAVHLDYDLPKNPWPVRFIKDELRALSPNLFLGQMYVAVGQTPKLGSWFALERV